jgi:hypothetical protein
MKVKNVEKGLKCRKYEEKVIEKRSQHRPRFGMMGLMS